MCPWLLLTAGACSTTTPVDPVALAWTAVDSGTDASLRGLSVVSADVAWASGSGGVVLRTTDGGTRWTLHEVAAAGGGDLRSIHAFDARRAVAATAGAPARIVATDDGGASWTVVHEERDPAAFLDSIRFADAGHGLVFGDPLGDGRHFVLASDDGGRTWRRLASTPAAVAGEAGFAASGTCIATDATSAWIATGGARTRVLATDDRGASWRSADLPLRHGAPSQGAFSIARHGARHGVAVGGDYRAPDRTDGTAAFTTDGGTTWLPAERPPGGYRSCVAFAPALGPAVCVAVGTNGADASTDGGRTWRPLDAARARLEHHAVRFAPGAARGFAVGPGGRITRIAPD